MNLWARYFTCKVPTYCSFDFQHWRGHTMAVVVSYFIWTQPIVQEWLTLLSAGERFLVSFFSSAHGRSFLPMCISVYSFQLCKFWLCLDQLARCQLWLLVSVVLVVRCFGVLPCYPPPSQQATPCILFILHSL